MFSVFFAQATGAFVAGLVAMVTFVPFVNLLERGTPDEQDALG